MLQDVTFFYICHLLAYFCIVGYLNKGNYEEMSFNAVLKADHTTVGS